MASPKHAPVEPPATEHTAQAPQLPPVSIDFDALQEACRAGMDPDKALEVSIVEPEPHDVAATEQSAEEAPALEAVEAAVEPAIDEEEA